MAYLQCLVLLDDLLGPSTSMSSLPVGEDRLFYQTCLAAADPGSIPSGKSHLFSKKTMEGGFANEELDAEQYMPSTDSQELDADVPLSSFALDSVADFDIEPRVGRPSSAKDPVPHSLAEAMWSAFPKQTRLPQSSAKKASSGSRGPGSSVPTSSDNPVQTVFRVKMALGLTAQSGCVWRRGGAYN